jgi:hypothetical protein
MSGRLKSAVAARLERVAVRWSGLTGAAQDRSALLIEVRQLGVRIDALEAGLTDMWRRSEVAADNRALGLEGLALRVQAESVELADERHQRSLDAAERSADALVVNVRRSIEGAARELHAVAADLRSAATALEAERSRSGG